MQLNKIGEDLGAMKTVHAMTDVTGFGLAGHLLEMCEGSGTSAELYYDKLPVIPAAKEYLLQRTIPGGTRRNRDSYGHKISFADQVDQQEALDILPDPQTNGGLLIAVSKEGEQELRSLLEKNSLCTPTVIGKMIAAKDKKIYVV